MLQFTTETKTQKQHKKWEIMHKNQKILYENS